jgi:hypothetical protein
MKPLSKYHHKAMSVYHKNELAITVHLNKLTKINKEELQYEITGTSTESTQRQRKPVNKVEKPVKNDEASSDSESSEEILFIARRYFHSQKLVKVG